MRLAPLCTLLAIGCFEGPLATATGESADFEIFVPEVDAPSDINDAVPFPDTEVPEEQTWQTAPLLEPGVYTMRIHHLEGEACWPEVVQGESMELIVEEDSVGARLDGFVTLRRQGADRAWGIGSRGSEVSEGCLQTEALFVSAMITGNDRFDAHFEINVGQCGEGCEVSSSLLPECMGSCEASLRRSGPLPGDTGGQ